MNQPLRLSRTRRMACALATLVPLLAGCYSARSTPSVDADRGDTVGDAFALVAEADRLAAMDLWPGFDARSVPVAIYDGRNTLLFRHPGPPEGFAAVPGYESVRIFSGRHPSVTANSSTELGGTWTATVLPPTDSVSFGRRAALLIHEAFHVFQRERHPAWSANEVELFTYPVDDLALLALRRLETEGLRRALASTVTDDASCWARTALDLRRARFAALSAEAVAYERKTELNEGLATYVGYHAGGEANAAAFPTGDFGPEAVRQRAYRTGLALGLLLDRLSPSWRNTLEQNDTIPLDDLLSAAVRAHATGAARCDFTPAERDDIRATATADIESLRIRRAEQRRLFIEQPGWRVVIIAPASPLFPQGFDPLNVQVLTPGEVLHTRFLKLGNEAGTIEVLGRTALTEAAGAHPLYNGVRVVTLAGLSREPVVTDTASVVVLDASGATAQLRGAAVERTGQTVTIRLPAPP